MGDDNNPNLAKLFADNPIRNEKDDVLGRSKAAKTFAQNVLNRDASEGLVVGVFGPWGAGKTSFVNLARKEFEKKKASVVEFNPWMFSNSQQLVERFFTEISSQLKIPKYKNIDVAKELKLLAGDFATNTIAVLSKGYAQPIAERWNKYKEDSEDKERNEGWGVINRRKKIEKALKSLGKGKKDGSKEIKMPIVVILDDVDRLSDKEIGDVFRLIRLTANFPNVIYVVPCDRGRIEKALNKEYEVGRNFLEKIIQFGYDLPQINKKLLMDQLDHSIASVLSTIKDKGPLDEAVLEAVRDRTIYPLVRNIRDVRRYASAIQDTFSSLEGKVAQADVLALEAVRLFVPDIFRRLASMIDVLTFSSKLSKHHRFRDTSSRTNPHGEAYYTNRLKELFDVAEEHVWIVYFTIDILFPHAVPYMPGLKYTAESTIPEIISISSRNPSVILDEMPTPPELASRCVAHADVFLEYLDRTHNEGIEAIRDVENILDSLRHAGELNSYLWGLDNTRFFNAMICLNEYTDKLLPEHVESGVVELSNRMYQIFGISEISSLTTLKSVACLELIIVSLLKTSPHINEEQLFEIFNAIKPLSVKFQLFSELDPVDGDVGNLVSDSIIETLEQSLRGQIIDASIDDLAKEWYLPRFLPWGMNDDLKKYIRQDDDPKFTLLVIWGFRSEAGDVILDRSIERYEEKRISINWNDLIKYYDENILKSRVKNMCEDFDEVESWAEANGLPKEKAEKIKELAEEWLGNLNDK